MPRLTLVHPALESALQIEVEVGTRLIDALRLLGHDGVLSLPWRCGQGTCGACRLWLDDAGQGPAETVLGSKERNVLVRHRHLPADASTRQLTLPDLPRLACHVLMPAYPLTIRW